MKEDSYSIYSGAGGRRWLRSYQSAGRTAAPGMQEYRNIGISVSYVCCIPKTYESYVLMLKEPLARGSGPHDGFVSPFKHCCGGLGNPYWVGPPWKGALLVGVAIHWPRKLQQQQVLLHDASIVLLLLAPLLPIPKMLSFKLASPTVPYIKSSQVGAPRPRGDNPSPAASRS